MLYNNQSYSGFLQSWANFGNISAFFASVTAKIAMGIQWVLQQVYGIVNKNYMGLSRQMEFHADAVAASVSGSKNLVTALRRVELADAGYNIALQKCDDLLRKKMLSENVYDGQRLAFQHIASEFKLPLRGGLPVINNEFLEDNNRSRINYKDQWASHPSTEDREKHLNSLAIDAEVIDEPAWNLFDDPQQLQTRLTLKIYEHVTKEKDMVTIGIDEFKQKFYSEVEKFTIPEIYNRFYDNRQVAITDMNSMSDTSAIQTIEFADIFSTSNAGIYKKINALSTDIEILKAIADKRIRTKTFDFDGNKFDRSDAGSLVEKLEKEKESMQLELDELDKKAIIYFLEKAKQLSAEKESELRKMYSTYFEQRTKAKEYLAHVNSMLESLGPIYSGQMIPIEQINSMISDLKNEREIKFKGWLKGWLGLGVFEDGHEKIKIEKFIATNYEYFSGTTFFDTELADLNSICNESWNSINSYLFDRFRKILEFQVELISK
jgi:hypothetical protein